MAGTIHYHHSLNSFYSAVLDPKSLILSQFSNSDQPPQLLQLTTQSFYMERGPRYEDYAVLRESKLRMKSMKQPILEEEQEEEEMILSPPQKHVRFQGTFVTAAPKRPKPPSSSSSSSSVLTQSVPDFSSALRKENRKPRAPALPPMMEKSLTPPPLKSRSGKFDGMSVGKLGGPGSKSVNSGEKMSGGLMTRKSYANVEDLRGLASEARNAINAENRGGGRIGRGPGKSVLSYRQY